MSMEIVESEKFVTKTLGDLFGLEGAPAKAPWMVSATPSPLAPEVNPHYLFREDLLRRVIIWASGAVSKNLLLGGPTGSGKTSLPEQFCARTGWAYYKVSCHGRMEFAELVGQLTILSDGSTQFIDGPLVRAMKEGAVLLLDEFNFVPPVISGALNTVLDGSALLIPTTGELVKPHPRFRIAATGNAMDRGDDAASYAGTQRMNLAMIQRFLTVKVNYMERLEEAKVLHRMAPKLPGKIITVLVDLANDVREAHVKGDLDTTIATRTLEKIAKLLTTRLEALKVDPDGELKFALKFVLTDGLHPASAQMVEGLFQRIAGGLKLAPSDWPKDGQAAASMVEAAKSSIKAKELSKQVVMKVLVNPDRSGDGPAFWASAVKDGEPTASLYSGSFNNPILRTHRAVSMFEANKRADEKAKQRGYTMCSIRRVSKVEVVAHELAKLLSQWQRQKTFGAVASVIMGVEEDACLIATEIVRDLGGTTQFMVKT